MIYDRPYMREPEAPRFRPPSATSFLLVLNLVMFILQNINQVYVQWPLEEYFALSRKGLADGHLWQLFTFQFLHLGSWHFICNALGLFFLGRPLEHSLGPGRLVEVYFGSSFLGGVLQGLLGLLLPGYFGMPTLGASAGVYGLLATFATLDRHQTLLFLPFFPIRAGHLLFLTLGITIFFVLVPSEPGVAHAAHLGGLLGGMAYVHWILRAERRLFQWRRVRRAAEAPPELVNATGPSPAPRARRERIVEEDLGPAEFISREVDPILDKISAHGLQSLTERERRILDKARAKILKR